MVKIVKRLLPPPTPHSMGNTYIILVVVNECVRSSMGREGMVVVSQFHFLCLHTQTLPCFAPSFSYCNSRAGPGPGPGHTNWAILLRCSFWMPQFPYHVPPTHAPTHKQRLHYHELHHRSLIRLVSLQQQTQRSLLQLCSFLQSRLCALLGQGQDFP